MLARAVGTAPWLDRRTVRAVLATRLRTLLDPETGVSPALAPRSPPLLDADLHPAVPATGNGAAGEIIPLAHLGGVPHRHRRGLDDAAPVPAGDALAGAGLAPYTFGGEGGRRVPAGRARRHRPGGAARRRRPAARRAAAGGRRRRGRADPRAPRPLRRRRWPAATPSWHRARRAAAALAGDEPHPRMLQAPVSFRVAGPAVAHLLRSAGHLDEAVERGADRGEHLARARRRPVPRHGRLRRLRPRGVAGRRTPRGAARSPRPARRGCTGCSTRGSPGCRRSCRRARAAGRPGRGAQARGRPGARGAARRRPRRSAPWRPRWARRTCRASGSRRAGAARRGRRAARRDRVRAARRAPGDAARTRPRRGAPNAANGVAQGF